MLDLRSQYLGMKQEIDEAMQKVVDSATFVNGPQVSEFASCLAAFNGAEHVVTCANGTDALQIAFMALGLVPGDEVIVPAFTYVASAEVIALLGLKPVFVDCLCDSFNIDVSKIRDVISPRTRAVVPVHLFGQCADMEPLLKIACEFDLFVVEDAAQAIGAEYRFSDGSVSMAGSMGDFGITSFFPSKNLACFGDGGALFSNSDDLALRARMIANHGQVTKYHHDVIGCNSRLDSIQAAVLNVKIKFLDEFNRSRQSLAEFYDEAFKDVCGVEIPKRVNCSSHVFHQYTIKVRGGKRDALRDALAERGVPSMIYYPIPLHLQGAFGNLDCCRGDFPVSESLCDVVLSLPMHTEMSDVQASFVVESVKVVLSRLF